MVATPFPLAWPTGRPRRSPSQRKSGKFGKQDRQTSGWNSRRDITVAEAIARLEDELGRIGAKHAVVSTNIEPRLDGRPRSGQAVPSDPGVAVYFQLGQKSHCLPCDTYQTVADNLAAVAAHIEATRAIERHGVASVAEMFSGFAALPSPERPPMKWWEVMKVPRDAPKWMVDAAYKHEAKIRHPDAGGTEAAMAELNAARDAAQKEPG